MKAIPILFLLMALFLVFLARAYAHDEEHPFRMPGAPAKVVPAPAPWFTGDKLLLQLDPPHGVRGRDAAIAEGSRYLQGVFDATESGLWCYTDGRHAPTPKQLPEVVRASALNYLRQLPPARLREKAAVLIVEMWQERWPCPPDGCCPGRGY